MLRSVTLNAPESLSRQGPPRVPARRHSDPGHTHTRFYFTVDCDWVPGSQVGLEYLLCLCQRLNLKGTFFFAGRFADTYPDLVRICHAHGHQLGTHGWAHGGVEEDEDFRRADYRQQREWIRRATHAVERASGVRPTIFRAPNLWISPVTFDALEAEGYRYDSSIPARRFDMGFGRVHYLTYFWAPLGPYRPSRHDLTEPGGQNIIEIAPSSCLFPINLATLRTLGLPILRCMIRWITQRSRHLVFYCHPSEFVHARAQQFPRSMSRWNRRGMRPENLVLLEELMVHIIKSGFIPTQMTDIGEEHLDLKQTTILRASKDCRSYP
jgi:peptidoglycan/xylan/chitin deacetylase (PgdA/CDA1 family)